jgi:glycosyltransferase involved in cell wall biosynthesis
MSPFFSVIIPAYNVGPYIEQCVDSVLEQTFKDLEIIIIDDASMDETSSICDNYAEIERERVRVVHLVKNAGPAGARNRGLELAKGAYILFLDSDDWFTDGNFLTDAHELIASTKAEMILFGYVVYSNKRQGVIKVCDSTFLGGEVQKVERVIPDLVKSGKMTTAAWLRLVVRSLVDTEKGEIFNEELRNSEDLEWIFRVLMKCKTVVSLCKSPLAYRIRDDSVCKTPNTMNTWMNSYNAMRLSVAHTERCDIDPDLRDALRNYLAYQYYLRLADIRRLPDKMDRRQAYGLIKEYEYLGQLACDRRTLVLKLLSTAFGSRIASYIMGCYLVRGKRFLERMAKILR